MSRIFKSEGIIFKSLKYSETSLILDIYTKEIGIQSFIVSGVRKSKSKFSNIFQPMNIIDLVAYRSENKLSRIKENGLAVSYSNLNSHVVLSTLGMFIIDLSRNVIKEREVNLELYNFIRSQLLKLDSNPDKLNLMPIQYALSLASFLGFEITNNFTLDAKYFDLISGRFVDNNVANALIMNENLSYKLHQLLSQNNTAALDKDERNLLLDKVLKFYELHMEGFKPLKSLPVLRTILS